MKNWVECVPNFSEGRRSEVLDRLAAAITSVSNAYLLDREMDASHNRSVFTIAGPPQAVREAVFAAVRTARDLIDLNIQSGEHPRIGATDVVPFVPLGESTMESCVLLARELGRQIWEELGIPVYLYEEAATRPERRNLADLRKGEFEGLREEVKTNPARHPDFGEAALHPTAGATVVGARWFLIAFNAYLSTNDIRIAKEIAKAVRFSSGGFRYVKALGFTIKERDQVQISMNLVNYRASTVHHVVEFIRREAQHHGVALVSTEIVGLMPQEALNMAAAYYLQVGQFSANLILENRIQEAIAAEAVSPPTLRAFLESIASSRPTPGGGSASALSGSLAASLGRMVSDLTLSQDKYKAVHAEIHPHSSAFALLQQELYRLIEDDSRAYERLIDSFKLPKSTDEEKAARQLGIEAATRQATEVPMQTASVAVRVLESLAAIREGINPNAMSDLGVGAQMALAAAKGAIYNVRTNLSSMPDTDFKRSALSEAESLWQKASSLAADIEQYVLSKLG